MKPIQRIFVPPRRSVQRVDLTPPNHALGLHASGPTHNAECEVWEMDSRMGSIEWRESLRDYERAYEDTAPSPLA